jgi:hypothetical protein
MTMTASQMGLNSAKARRKKHGGSKGFSEHMRKLAIDGHKKRKLDKRSQTTPNRKSE